MNAESNLKKGLAALTPEQRAENTRKAQARIRELRESGQLATDPIHKAKLKPTLLNCLKGYFWDYHGVLMNSGANSGDVNIGELKAAALADFNERRQFPRKAIKAICYNCVGGVDSVTLDGSPSPGGDGGGKLRVRDCAVTSCPLHPVRPWTRITGRKGAETDDSEDFGDD